MKYTIREDKKETKREAWLEESANGITLRMYDEAGCSWSILSINNLGFLELHECIGEGTGLKLNKDERIIIGEEQ